MTRILLFILFFLHTPELPANPGKQGRTINSDRITGRWISENKDLIVEVYRCRASFKAKVLWFDNKEEPDIPLNEVTDSKNPDPSLRKRKILGLEAVKELRYNPASGSWEGGLIYDSSSGREWSSYAFFTANGHLRVRGYWHFKFIGKSMDFLPYY